MAAHTRAFIVRRPGIDALTDVNPVSEPDAELDLRDGSKFGPPPRGILRASA